MQTPTCVLLIDDDETVRELVTAVLGDEGYAVVAVPDGPSALQAIRQSPPRLILLDSPTRGQLRRKFVDDYRQTPGPHAPIYLFSAASDAPDVAQQLGLAGTLPKPFDIEALVELAMCHGCVQVPPGH